MPRGEKEIPRSSLVEQRPGWGLATSAAETQAEGPNRVRFQESQERVFCDNFENASISLLIPAHNESESIAGLLDRAVEVMKGLGRAWEIIVVDDGSSDNTLESIKDRPVKIIAHPYNIGNGAAIKTGIRHANGEILVMMDADGQHDPNDIPRLIATIGPYDMVVGARTNGFDRNKHRAIANQCYNLLASYVAHFAIKDLTSGFRGIKSDVLKRFTYLLPNTFSYPSTLTLALLRAGYSLRYEPIVAGSRSGKSKIKLVSDGLRFVLIIFKIAIFFSPLKIFLPISWLFFALGLGNYAHTYFTVHRLTNMTVLCFVAGFLFFLLGLISEQIAQLRFDRSEDYR
jgi:glycosyltransferase involved in cell wall biosynthesis